MASEGDTYSTITLKGTPITELRVTDLKRELEKRGLSKNGSKQQLSDRLKAQLLLEKLQQDAAQSSGDEHEGKVPNMALQRDDKAGQSEFVRQYLQQQQRNLEIQMEMKKQVEEERKRKSADESSADESKNAAGSQAEKPDMTSEMQFKDGTSNAPAKEGAKMSKPARKSSRNSSKEDNGQEERMKKKSQSPVPEPDRPKGRAHSRSSSSSRSPSSDKNSRSRRGRSSRGRAKRGGIKRGGQQNKSRSSSSSSTGEEVAPKKNQSRRANSSSRSGSRSPQIASPEVLTRRSSRRSSTGHKATPDPAQEKEFPHGGSGDKLAEKTENVGEHLPNAPKKRWRKKPSVDIKITDPDQNKDESTKSAPATPTVLHTADSTNERKELESELAITNKKSNAVKGTESGTVSEPLRKTMTLIKGPETKLPKENLIEAAVPHDNVSGAVSSTTQLDKSQDTVAENVKVNEPAVKDSAKRPVSTQASRDGNKELIPVSKDADGNKELISVSKDAVSEKVELDKNKLVPEEKKNGEQDQPSKVGKENVPTGEANQTDSPVNENRGIPSPPRKVQRRSSYSSDSSSVESRSRSKSPIGKKQPRSGSSSSSSSNSRSRSSSSSSSTGASSPDKSKVGTQSQARGKDGRPGLSPERVVVHADKEKPESTKKSASVPKSIDANRKDDKTLTQPAVVGVQRSKSQEETLKQPGKELEEKPKGQHELTHADQEASRDSVSNADADEETVAKKGAKKRKWGSKTSKAAKTTKRTSSLEISSDVLKNLIGDVKLTETVFEMETEVVNTLDYDENEEDRRDVKVKRNVTSDVIQSPQAEEEEAKPEQEDARRVETRDDYSPEPAEIQSEPEKKIIKLTSAAPKVGAKTKLKDGKKKKGNNAGKENKLIVVSDKDSKAEKVFATTRSIKPLLPVVDEPEPVSSSQSPARNPVDRVIRIGGLVRPFTVGQLKELLRRSGELDDEYFWINAIKSHCLAAYKTQEEAAAARVALHGTRWPQSNPKILVVDFATVEDVIFRKTEGDMPLPALIKKPPPQAEQKKVKEQQVEEEKKEEKKHKNREQREKGRVEREKVERVEKRDTREQKREPEKRNPVREWDRDKIQQLSRSRSKSKERERLNRRSRSKDREQRKRRGQSKEKKVEDRRKEKKLKDTKAEDEPPAKLLDDLFRKTKATPCIYWLPLTEEQAQQRIVKKLELEKERQKRVAAAEEREKEELKKREAARLERQREREKARDKSRERERGDKGKQERSRSYSRSRSRRRR